LTINDIIVDDYNNAWFMPAEFMPHKRTWMIFGPSNEIWGNKLFSIAQQNVATIAKTIANYEPVTMLVTERDYVVAKKLVGAEIELIVCPLDDIWMRDIGPVFVLTSQGKKAAVKFNFNGWGGKQTYEFDAKTAEFVTAQAKCDLLKTSLVLEGGGIEVNGKGMAILSESCILNTNRNPFLSKTECEEKLKSLLGLKKIIWLPGIKNKEITDGHVDCYARFTASSSVVVNYNPNPAHFNCVVTQEHIKILKNATDTENRTLDVVVIDGPTSFREPYKNEDFAEDFAGGYLNYYVCNGAVIAQEFGDTQADGLAKEKLQTLFPNREIKLINIDAISAGGGGIHCITQQEPMDVKGFG
jgi:agmatine deiminase